MNESIGLNETPKSLSETNNGMAGVNCFSFYLFFLNIQSHLICEVNSIIHSKQNKNEIRKHDDPGKRRLYLCC